MKFLFKFCLCSIAAGSVVCLVSCNRDQEKPLALAVPDGDPLEIEARLDEVITGKDMPISAMDQDDIIVAVNGFPYRRRWFDAQVARLTKNMLSRKGANEYLIMDVMNQRKPLFVSQFVVRRLLLDHARKIKVMTDDELKGKMKEHIEKLQKASKKSASQISQALKTEKKYFFYEIAERILLDELISKHIPPITKVDDEFVAKVQKQVELENAALEKTNEMVKVQMREWKRDIESGRVTFAEVAEKHSQDFDGTSKIKGWWGDFEETDFEDRAFSRAVFSLPKGGVSEPLEDDNCIRMVQVVDIKPAETNAKGRVIQKEIRTLAHVYYEKVPELIRQSDKDMAADLRTQMQMQAIDFYANYLRTNGENRVVYPHGERLFE